MSIEALRHSRLKLIGDAPAKFAFPRERKEQFFDKGTGAHSGLLGGKEIVVWDKISDKGNPCPRRGKDFDAFAAEHVGRLILLPDEKRQVEGMVAAVKVNPYAMQVLEGRKEKTLLWDRDARRCRGTPDVDGGHYVTELKTSQSADPSRFYWDSKKYAYPAALAWYMDGIARQWPKRRVLPEEAYIVVVEPIFPHVVSVFRVPQSDLEEGARLNLYWLSRLADCEKANRFGGYVEGIVDLVRPDGERRYVDIEEEAA